MNLERGFNAVLSACAGDVRHLLALIAKVSGYLYSYFISSTDIIQRSLHQLLDSDLTIQQN